MQVLPYHLFQVLTFDVETVNVQSRSSCINFIFPLTKCGQRPTVCISVKSFTGEKFYYLGGGFQRIEKVDKLIRFILLDWKYKKQYLMGKIPTVDDVFIHSGAPCYHGYHRLINCNRSNSSLHLCWWMV